MRVRFLEAFDFTPPEQPRVQLSYSPTGGDAGDGEYTVRRKCGDAAVAAGKGVEVSAPGSSHV